MKHLGRQPYSCLITTGEATPANFQTERSNILATIRDAVRDGVTMIQVREKQLPATLLFALVRKAVTIAAGSSTLITVNDRADIAMSAGADGVHLPGDSFPPSAIRDISADRLLIGVSTHSSDDVLRAESEGADYVFFGPVFASPGKGDPAGLSQLEEVCRQSHIPVIGLGGIDETNFQNVIDAGASGVAAIRSLNGADGRRKILSGLADG